MTSKTFGEYLKELREAKDLTLRELARKTGMSAAYISDVENNRINPLTKERIEAVATVMSLEVEQINCLYDLAAKQRKEVAADLPEYIMENNYVTAALRTARDLQASEDEWQPFVDELKKRGVDTDV